MLSTGMLAALALAVALLARPGRAAAQAALRLDALRIELWPEYDQPSVLVMLDGRLAADTPLPATLALPIPAAAGSPHAAAYYDAGGNLLAADYITTAAGDDIIVTFSTATLNFRLEYYDPALAVAANQRSYSLNWTSPYAVAATAVRVQQPAGSSAFSSTPALAAEQPSGDGLAYRSGALGALTAGQTLAVALSYSKPDHTLSSAVMGQGAGATAPSAATNSATLPMVGAVAAVVVVLGGAAFFYMRRPAARRTRKRATARGRRLATPARVPAVSKPAAPQPVALAATTKNEFCTQCGTRRQPGDKFCRQCGAAHPA